MKTWVKSLPYFPRHELACKGTGVVKLDIRFAAKLPAAREGWGKPWTPSSVCRTPIHNSNERGHRYSLHLTENPRHDTWGACAIDVQWYSWGIEERLRFARYCFHEHGFSVGLHNSFCHLDLRTVAGLPQHCFLYGSWNSYFSPSDVMRR